MSTEDFLAHTSSTVLLVYMKHLCLCKNNMKSDVVETAESFVAYNVHTINIAVHRETLYKQDAQ